MVLAEIISVASIFTYVNSRNVLHAFTDIFGPRWCYEDLHCTSFTAKPPTVLAGRIISGAHLKGSCDNMFLSRVLRGLCGQSDLWKVLRRALKRLADGGRQNVS